MNYYEGQKEHHPAAWEHVGHEDVERMHLDFRNPHRRDRFVPPWALDDVKIRLVVYNYACNYARQLLGVRFKLKPGVSMRELEKACIEVRNQKLALVQANPNKYPHVEDHIRTTQNGISSRAVRIIYKAYRERLNAKDIAEALDMSWCAVRQILYRLNRIARELFPDDQQLPRHWTVRGSAPVKRPWAAIRQLSESEVTPEVRSIVDRYNAGIPVKEIAKQEGRSASSVRYRLHRSGLAVKPRKQIEEREPRKRVILSDEIIQRWKSGEHSHKLAAEIGIPTGTLRALLGRAGHVRGGKRKPKYSDEQLNELRRRWSAGESARKLAAEQGIPIRTFIARMNRRGFQRGPINGKRS